MCAVAFKVFPGPDRDRCGTPELRPYHLRVATLHPDQRFVALARSPRSAQALLPDVPDDGDPAQFAAGPFDTFHRAGRDPRAIVNQSARPFRAALEFPDVRIAWRHRLRTCAMTRGARPAAARLSTRTRGWNDQDARSRAVTSGHRQPRVRGARFSLATRRALPAQAASGAPRYALP